MSVSTLPEKIKAALSFQQAGQLDEAKSAFEAIISQHPDHPDAYHLLGLLLFEAGYHDQGMALVKRSVDMAPDNAMFLGNLGTILTHKGHHEDAVQVLSTALKAPDGQTPTNAVNIGRSLLALNRAAEARDWLAPMAQAHPDHIVVQRLMGQVAMAMGDANEAAAHYRRALELGPNGAVNHYNLGNALVLKRNLDDAETAYRKALHSDPEMAEAHAHLGTTLMLKGDLAGGWPEYEWRWKGEGFPNTQHAGPLWDGGDMNSGTLLLSTEQGFGDAFQFIRFAAQAKAVSGAHVVVETQKPIADLIATAPGVDDVVVRGSPLPAFDAQAPLMTLPMILGTTLETVPADVPYLTVDQDLRTKWAEELADVDGFKAGLVWRGNPNQLHNVYRSCPVEALTPLFDVPGVSWVGLQKDPRDDELAALPGLIDFGRRIKTFADTAAIQAELDLMVSVCTSTAHLAGALARPVWVMLSAASDWRWFLEGADSPWYPTAKLFRQPTLHDWDSVITAIAQELSERV